MKILHFAIENFARIPANMVKAEKKLGHDSFLVIPYKPSTYFSDEDYCLNLPLMGGNLKKIKSLFRYNRISNSNLRKKTNKETNKWNAGNKFLSLLFKIRDLIWEKKIRDFFKEVDIKSFDILFLDGGAGFLRSGKLVNELKEQDLKIIVTYCGSDFRSRGAIPYIENICDYRLTFEHDHTLIDPELDYYFAPFVLPDYSPKPNLKNSSFIRIGHAPTNRLAKGTEAIFVALEKLKAETNIEIVFIENLPHSEALQKKASCDIFIDNIGEIGYGINSLESLAMGVPTAVQIMPDLQEIISDHPFININEQNIYKELNSYIKSNKKREKKIAAGKEWVMKYHDPVSIMQKILGKL